MTVMGYTTSKIKSTRVAIAMGDGGNAETFNIVCGLTTKGLQQTRATTDTTDWDCTDPDAAPIIVRDAGAKDWSISGSGLLARSLLADVQAAFDSGNPTNFRFVYTEPVGNEIVDGYYQGPGIITDFSQNGENGNFVQISLTITGAAELSFVSNA
jgi:predicted secreted protein